MDLVKLGQQAFKRRGLMLPIAVLLFLLPSPPIAEDPVGIGILGLLLALLGQSIRVATIGLAYIIRGGKGHRVHADDLVTTGIYAHSRNPMYLGNAFLLAGLALASNSWLVAVFGTAIAVAWHAAIIAAEEDFLRGKFGHGFEAYCARVPRIVPRLRGISATVRSMEFSWRRVLSQEYAKPFDWIAAIAVVVLVNLWRADLLAVRGGVAAFLILVIVARLALWIAARQLRAGPASMAGSRR